jgi:hypothetical protein
VKKRGERDRHTDTQTHTHTHTTPLTKDFDEGHIEAGRQQRAGQGAEVVLEHTCYVMWRAGPVVVRDAVLEGFVDGADAFRVSGHAEDAGTPKP